MPLPPPQKLNTKDVSLSRTEDNTAETLRVLSSKQYLITGETALFLTATVTVPTDWVAVTAFSNAWVNFGATNEAAAYRKTADGSRVEINGCIRSGVIGATAFTLPAAYRPTLNYGFAVASNGAYGQLDVGSTGAVSPSVGSNVYFYLAGWWRPADTAPIPASCWPVRLACALPARPNAVLLAEAIETGSGARVVAANPDWDWETQQGVNFVIINNVPLLPPAATYDLTFLVLGEQ